MDVLNELFQELGISKVRLAKYLGVSRQMVYNYLELKDLNKWPKEKKLLLLKLLDVTDAKEIKDIKVNTDYLMAVEGRLNQGVKNSGDLEGTFDFKGLNKESQVLLSDITYLIKEKLSDESNKDNYYAILYLYHLLQSLDNVPEIKYIFAYLSKKCGFTNPKEFKFNETRQFILESIVFTAFNLYNNGGASKSKLVESHNRFEQEIENDKEEKLSRTQQLNTFKVQALKELGYTEITKENASEVLNKMAEIQSRKV